MSFRVIVQVQEEHLNKAIEEFSPILVKFGEIHKIPFEGSYLLDFKGKLSYLVTEAAMRLTSRGVPFNLRGNSYTQSVRFNHMGEVLLQFTQNSNDVANATRELLSARMWPDGCDSETAVLRAECVSMRFGWENQTKNGRRYAMLNLLEK